jgi:predicted nucleotidyltransferase
LHPKFIRCTTGSAIELQVLEGERYIVTAGTETVETAGRFRDEFLVADALPDAEELLALLLVGSQARGWANSTSDYDFCVVTRSPYRGSRTRTVAVPLDPPTTATRELVVQDSRCELAYWTSGQIVQMTDKVSWARYESGASSLKSLVEVEETLLERLATAVPLSGADWLEQQRAAVEDSAFRAFITTHSLSSADGKIEDIVGMLERGDIESAVLAARLALDHMIDAMLDSRGIYGSRIPKWRMRRMREGTELPLTPERYWDLTTMVGFRQDDPVAWVDEVVQECQALSLQIEI